MLLHKTKKQIGKTMPRPYFHDKESHIDEILRVNHAGEYGAIRIYQGQIARISENKSTIEEMLLQEEEHLTYFKNEITKRKTRPTLLMPLWHVGGYIMGYFTAFLGPKYAMLCTEAVEEVIDEHYAKQHELLQSLGDKELANKVEQHRLDEVEHKKIAIDSGSMEVRGYPYIKLAINSICKFAIWASKVF
ncbi:MAG UNVERIFIED_CONTAM: demethoxyubiquinone hydroxylase family protein [Rickettsiaceae bacterium]|jgi:ubiquinone biosynthesis monooxygenase Coq7